ncbi:hypothetical protein [Mycobacterium phage WXIN]|nr:hypothetical protein [Mycobacterium phage WXIN]
MAVAPLASDLTLGEIYDLLDRGLISDEMAERGKEVIDLLFVPSTVYAAIGPDGGDLLFYWVAGRWSVSIDLYSETVAGDDTWWSVRRDGEIVSTGVAPGLPRELAGHLAEFSAYVESVNPNWRSL